MNRAEVVIAILTKHGWYEDDHFSTDRYRGFAHANHQCQYFVARRDGLLRYGMTADTSTALFQGDRLKQDRWLADMDTFMTIGTKPRPLSRRDEDIA